MFSLWQRVGIAGVLIAGLAGCVDSAARADALTHPILTAPPTQPPIPTPKAGALGEVEAEDLSSARSGIPRWRLDRQSASAAADHSRQPRQITPLVDSLEWKNQGAAPYRMTHLTLNTYQFTDPTAINDVVVIMTVTFLSAERLTMAREFIPQVEPGCARRHECTSAFKWSR